jgi:hypothetical protein
VQVYWSRRHSKIEHFIEAFVEGLGLVIHRGTDFSPIPFMSNTRHSALVRSPVISRFPIPDRKIPAVRHCARIRGPRPIARARWDVALDVVTTLNFLWTPERRRSPKVGALTWQHESASLVYCQAKPRRAPRTGGVYFL